MHGDGPHAVQNPITGAGGYRHHDGQQPSSLAPCKLMPSPLAMPGQSIQDPVSHVKKPDSGRQSPGVHRRQACARQMSEDRQPGHGYCYGIQGQPIDPSPPRQTDRDGREGGGGHREAAGSITHPALQVPSKVTAGYGIMSFAGAFSAGLLSIRDAFRTQFS